MSGIVLQTRALKIVNKRGKAGTDYVVFICPAGSCGQRNKKSVYQRLYRMDSGELVFACRCGRSIEVAPPAPKEQPFVRYEKLIVTPEEFSQSAHNQNAQRGTRANGIIDTSASR